MTLWKLEIGGGKEKITMKELRKNTLHWDGRKEIHLKVLKE